METLGALVDGVVAFERLIAWATAGRADLIESAVHWSELTALTLVDANAASTPGPRWDAGMVAFRTVVSELATALRLPDRTAESLVGESRALVQDLPATHEALRSGRITYRHAQVTIEHAMSVPAEARTTFEAAVLPDAEELTVAKFDRKARRIRERMHPESIRERHLRAVADRCVQHQPGRDGMAWLGAHLPATDVLGIYARVSDIAVGLQGADEPRTLSQLRADVFTDLLTDGVTTGVVTTDAFENLVDAAISHAVFAGSSGSPGTSGTSGTSGSSYSTGPFGPSGPAEPSDRRGRRVIRGIGKGVRARVFVTVPVLTLLGRSEEPGALEGYGPIDADTARRLAGEARGFTRILTHPETGVVLSVGRDRYKVPKAMRTWLRIRDETCRFPGCSRSAGRCDVDHTVDWQFGTCTAHDNLAHLCRLCRCRHKRHYADVGVMPMLMVESLFLLVSGWMLSA